MKHEVATEFRSTYFESRIGGSRSHGKGGEAGKQRGKKASVCF